MLRVFKQKHWSGDVFDTFWGQVLSALIVLLGTRVLTEMVSPEIFGQVALLNGIAVFGAIIFSYHFIYAGMRLLRECRNYRERSILNKVVFRLTFQSSIFAIFLLMLSGAVFCYLTDWEIGLFALTGLLLAVVVRREFGVLFLLGEKKQYYASLWLLGDSILRPLLAIWLVWGLGQNPEAVLLGYVIAGVVSNSLWTIINSEWKEKCSPKQSYIANHYRRDVWEYALSLIPIGFIFCLSNFGDRYVIGYLLTTTEVGLYVATQTVVNEVFNRIGATLLRHFQPTYFQMFSACRYKQAFSVLWLWTVILIGLGSTWVVLVMIGKEWLASILLAKSYRATAELMPIIAIGSALNAIGTVMAQPLMAEKRVRALLKARVAGVLAVAISLPLMVNYFGLFGAAIANPIYFGIEAFIIALLAKPWNPVPPMRSRRTELAQTQSAIPDFESIREKSAVLSTEFSIGDLLISKGRYSF